MGPWSFAQADRSAPRASSFDRAQGRSDGHCGEHTLAIHHLEHVPVFALDFRDAPVWYETLRQGTGAEGFDATDQEIERFLDLFMVDP